MSYGECHYDECHYDECHLDEWHYVECHYDECHYDERHGAHSKCSQASSGRNSILADFQNRERLQILFLFQFWEAKLLSV